MGSMKNIQPKILSFKIDKQMDYHYEVAHLS